MSISFWPAIQQVSGGLSGSPGPISRDSQWTIVGVTTSIVGGNEMAHVELPSGCDIGDVVEVHNDGALTSVNPQIVHPSGETFNNGAAVISGPRLFRKISSTVWGFIG